jgi:hypothetical protein
MLLSAALMTVLYLALLVIVSRAARALRAQHAALQREIRERTEIAAEAHRAQRATERAQRETEAAYALAMEARRTAVAADKAREALVASLRDGMRAPLNGIVGLADVLRGETSNAVQRDHVGRLRDCAVSLLAQLEDHAGVAAGPVVAAPFLPEAVVQDVVALYTPAARATGARLGCAVEPGTPGCVEGDGLGLRHLLRDLVGAALGHVPDGSVVVRVERVPGGTASIGRPGEPPDAPDAAEPGDALCWSVRVESPALFEGLSRFAADADAPARSWRGTFFDTRAVDRSAAALGATLSLKSDGHRFITVRLLTRHRPAAPAVVTADVTRVPAGAPHAMPAPRHAAAWPTTRRYEPEPAAALLPLPTDELEVDDDLPWAGQPTPA